MNKAVLLSLFVLLSVLCLSFIARAEEDLYSIIVKKNLFSPNRTEWKMEDRQQKPEVVQKNIPKLDPQKLNLMGTIITGERKRAVINVTQTPGKQRKQSRNDTDLYMIGDYIQGYRINEIKPKHVVLVSHDQEDNLTLFLHDGKDHKRPAQKTPVPVAPAQTSKPKPPEVRTQKAAPAELMGRMKNSYAALKQKNNPNVRQQFEKDYNELRSQFTSMSPQQRREAILLKQQVDKIKKQGK